MKRGRKLMVGLAAAVVLLVVFAAYLRPDLMLTLANQIWSCF